MSDDESASLNGSSLAFEESEDAVEGAVPAVSRPRAAYACLGPADVAAERDKALESVVQVLGCTRGAAQTMLIHFRWSPEALLGCLAERGLEQLHRVSGVASRSASVPAPEEVTECKCCFCPFDEDSPALSMSCGHAFCLDCWQQHCKLQVAEGQSRILRCMGERCGAVCDEEKVRAILRDVPDSLARYQQHLCESYVDDNSAVVWCPSVPCCGHAVQARGDPHCEPTCACGHSFCFACQSEPHSPATCDMWRRWREKCEDDSETKTWMQANTKPCPKCSKPVEKNGGCNLVSCRCGAHFCWLCGGATGVAHTYTSISNHSCGRFKEELDKRISEAQRNLKRYHHYFQRWDGHTRSCRLECRTQQQLEKQVEEAQQQGDRYTDYGWLTQALEQLFVARRLLGCSYVLAFYFFGDAVFAEELGPAALQQKQLLFENSQQELEGVIEKLSAIMEYNHKKILESGEELRLQVINLTVSVEMRLRKMYESVENDLLGALQITPAYIAPYLGCAQHAKARPAQLAASEEPAESSKRAKRE